jgi:hypothetical protein
MNYPCETRLGVLFAALELIDEKQSCRKKSSRRNSQGTNDGRPADQQDDQMVRAEIAMMELSPQVGVLPALG